MSDVGDLLTARIAQENCVRIVFSAEKASDLLHGSPLAWSSGIDEAPPYADGSAVTRDALAQDPFVEGSANREESRCPHDGPQNSAFGKFLNPLSRHLAPHVVG